MAATKDEITTEIARLIVLQRSPILERAPFTRGFVGGALCALAWFVIPEDTDTPSLMVGNEIANAVLDDDDGDTGVA